MDLEMQLIEGRSKRSLDMELITDDGSRELRIAGIGGDGTGLLRLVNRRRRVGVRFGDTDST
jgi:hypothetical protein